MLFKMANFPITFGDFFIVIFFMLIMGPLHKYVWKKCIFEAIIICLTEWKSFVNWFIGNFSETNVH